MKTVEHSSPANLTVPWSVRQLWSLNVRPGVRAFSP